jgi:hypothetical protein
MKINILGLMALTLAAAPISAQVQTYDLDIVMKGIQGIPTTTFEGSFTFNPAGTCSSNFSCAAGTTPEFTKVSISDPLSGGAFTGIDYGYSSGLGSLNFTDALGGSLLSSTVYQLQFNTNAPLGGPARSIGLNSIAFYTEPNVTGAWSCGGPERSPNGGVTCPVATLTKAPEIDPASAASGLTLLLGSLLVVRGRRPRKALVN